MSSLVTDLKVVALAGGVGGARLADGLAQVLPPQNLVVIVNTGDDFEHFGLKICPDLDTVCYTLAGLADPATGWGRQADTLNVLESLEALGAPVWFRLGDRDLATHLERTRLLKDGMPLSHITQQFCRSWGIACHILPMSDETVATWVHTNEGYLPFQEYFVHRLCRPQVTGFTFEGREKARSAPGVLEAIAGADLVVICPSNPWVSIDPILSVPGIRPALASHPVIAVSPIIGGQALKGPAAKMFSELGIQPSPLAVARHYGIRASGGLLAGLVLDFVDQDQVQQLAASELEVLATGTVMRSAYDRRNLAASVLQFGIERFFAR